MKKLTVILLILLILSMTAAAQEAQEIVDRADQAFEMDRVYSVSTLTVTRSGRDQAPQIMEGFMMDAPDGTSRSLSVFSAPPRVAGTAYLMIGDDLWVRFASTGRIRKMSSSAKKNSAAGSDFSYADMGEGSSSFTADYTPGLLGRETLDGRPCWKIELIPREPDEDLYEKMTAWIAVDNYEYLQIEYTEDGAPIKVMTLSDYRPVGDARYPFEVTMRSLVEDSVSRVITQSIEPDSPKVEDRFFSSSYLRTIR